MIDRREAVVEHGNLRLHSEVFEGDGPPIVLVMGVGAQMLLWPDALCERLAAVGHRVIRFDNRDVGLSSKLDHLPPPSLPGSILRQRLRRSVPPPYTLSDMAIDTLMVMDHHEITSATVVGASMGGMIAQRLALMAPERVSGLVSVMSSPSSHFLPRLGTLRHLLQRPPPDREGVVEHSVGLFTAMGSRTYPPDPDQVRVLAGRLFDRGTSPAGFLRQFAAILADGDRAPLLGALRMPRLVIHGDEDTLIPPRQGVLTASAMRAPLALLPGMGHDLPEPLWPELVRLITSTR